MKSILYTIVATALISIVPFLISFNPECVPYRGIMIYSIFAILLFFPTVKEKCSHKKQKAIAFAITYVLVVAISLIDTKAIVDLLKISATYYLIPFATSAFALFILKDTKRIPLRYINTALFCALFLHFAMFIVADGQPFLTFTLMRLF